MTHVILTNLISFDITMLNPARKKQQQKEDTYSHQKLLIYTIPHPAAESFKKCISISNGNTKLPTQIGRCR